MAIKEWGFVHIPIGNGKPRRAEFLIGYPFSFNTVIITAKNYYTGGMSAAKRLLRGFGF